VCKQFTCVGGGVCTFNGDCSYGQYCVGGQCSGTGGCFYDSDCAVDEFCYQHFFCVLLGAQCRNSRDCPTGEGCENTEVHGKQCVPNNPPVK
jgi:hypothetical protein